MSDTEQIAYVRGGLYWPRYISLISYDGAKDVISQMCLRSDAGPDLPFGLNNPFGEDIQETREASKMPANRSAQSGTATQNEAFYTYVALNFAVAIQPVGGV